MKWFVLSILIAPVLSPALSAQNQPPSTTTISASTNRFAFAKPNETTPEQAIQQLGERFSDYKAYLLEGKINPFPLTGFTRISQTYAEARRLRVKVIEARVLTWQVPEWKWEQAALIFNGGKLWYAIYPPPPSESNTEQLTALFGGKPLCSTLDWTLTDVIEFAELYAYPERGVIYKRAVRGDGKFDTKIVFPPRGDLPPLWWPRSTHR